MRLILAPLEGLADHRMRDLVTRQGGVDFCVAAFVRVSGSLLPPRAFLRQCPELAHGGLTPAGVPVRVQLLGDDPACLADNAARAVELGAPGVDLNFGCPSPTVNRHGGGAALLREPERLYGLATAVRAAVPAAVPFSAKMRLGWADPAVAPECARALVAGGVDELTVHARTREDGYRPPARWEWLARVREAVAVPVVANGEVWTVEDCRRLREASGCEDVMLGRGLVTRPDLARRIRDGGEPLDWAGLRPLLAEYYAAEVADVGVRGGAGRLKQWLALLETAYPEAAALRARLRRLLTPEEIAPLL